MSQFYTRSGDGGSTGLLGSGRVPKNDLRMEALGAVDETSAALGLARSLCQAPGLSEMILQVQRELYRLMSEVAASEEAVQRFHSIDANKVAWVEEQADWLSQRVNVARDFIVPGDTPAGAAIDLARAVARRAERRLVDLMQRGDISNPELIKFMNRLSSLIFLMELYETQASGKARPTLAKDHSA
jgi:cob(I)alamin adenosyltransferase